MSSQTKYFDVVLQKRSCCAPLPVSWCTSRLLRSRGCLNPLIDFLKSALNAVINKSKESAIHQLRRPLIRLLIACVTGVCSLVQAQKPSDVEDSRSRSSSSSSSKRIKHSKSGDQGAVTLCNCAYTISLLRSTVAAALKGDKVAKRADNAVWLLEMLGMC